MKTSRLSSVKRKEEKKRRQREAAISLALDPEVHSDAVTKVCRLHHSNPRRDMMIMPPSTFVLQNFDASEWTMVQRRKSILARQRFVNRGRGGLICRSSRASPDIESGMLVRPLDSVANSNLLDAGQGASVKLLGQMGRQVWSAAHQTNLANSFVPEVTPKRNTAGGARRLLGFVWDRSKLSLAAQKQGCLAPIAMANRGGGSGYHRGRGGFGGRGDPRRSQNFHEGGPSGYAGSRDEDSGNQHARPGFNGYNNFEGSIEGAADRPNVRGGGNGRGGGRNFRRYTGNGGVGRVTRTNSNGGSFEQGISELQERIIRDTAAAVAKQFAEQAALAAGGRGCDGSSCRRAELGTG